MWRDIKNGKPTEEGLYVVAQFKGDEMVKYNFNYCFIEGYFGPNNLGYSEPMNVTHWMSYSEYLRILEATPREKIK